MVNDFPSPLAMWFMEYLPQPRRASLSFFNNLQHPIHSFCPSSPLLVEYSDKNYLQYNKCNLPGATHHETDPLPAPTAANTQFVHSSTLEFQHIVSNTASPTVEGVLCLSANQGSPLSYLLTLATATRIVAPSIPNKALGLTLETS